MSIPVTNTNETKFWYNKNNQRHREDGPAVEYADGSKEWFINGLCHREDGPAVELANGNKYWCKNDELHRDDGPAVERVDGSKEWFLNGNEYSEDEFKLLQFAKGIASA